MSSKTINTNLTKLEKSVKFFENQDYDISKGLKEYESSMKLIDSIKKELFATEQKINEIHGKYNPTEL